MIYLGSMMFSKRWTAKIKVPTTFFHVVPTPPCEAYSPLHEGLVSDSRRSVLNRLKYTEKTNISNICALQIPV